MDDFKFDLQGQSQRSFINVQCGIAEQCNYILFQLENWQKIDRLEKQVKELKNQAQQLTSPSTDLVITKLICVGIMNTIYHGSRIMETIKFQDFSRTYYPFSGTFFQIFSNIIAIEFKCLEKFTIR